MYMTHRYLSAEASSQAVSLQQVDQRIQQQVDHRIQDALKAAKHHTHSSPSLSVLSTGKLLCVCNMCACAM